MVRAQMPRGGPAHRESAHGHAVSINAVKLLNPGDSFKGVRLAGKFHRVAKSSIGIKHKPVRRRKRPGLAALPIHERNLAQLVVATVIPDIQTTTLVVPLPIRRHLHHQRLQGTVYARAIGTHHQSGFVIPWRRADDQFFQALASLGQELSGGVKFLRPIKDVVFKSPFHPHVEDLRVWKESGQFRAFSNPSPRRFGELFQRGDFPFEFNLDRRRNRYTGLGGDNHGRVAASYRDKADQQDGWNDAKHCESPIDTAKNGPRQDNSTRKPRQTGSLSSLRSRAGSIIVSAPPHGGLDE